MQAHKDSNGDEAGEGVGKEGGIELGEEENPKRVAQFKGHNDIQTQEGSQQDQRIEANQSH